MPTIFDSFWFYEHKNITLFHFLYGGIIDLLRRSLPQKFSAPLVRFILEGECWINHENRIDLSCAQFTCPLIQPELYGSMEMLGLRVPLNGKLHFYDSKVELHTNRSVVYQLWNSSYRSVVYSYRNSPLKVSQMFLQKWYCSNCSKSLPTKGNLSL